MALKKSELTVGQTHSALLVQDLKRTQIVQYAGASGDYNPVHTDEKFVTEAVGYPTVFAHGMLTMGMTGKMLTDYVGDGRLTDFGVRFSKQVWPGDSLTGHCTITAMKKIDNGTEVVELSVETKNQHGDTVLTGNATATIDV